jgi:hypothetical protein
MRPVVKPTITQYNFDDYDVMRRYLFPAIGAYCSYCEQPISNDSAVEHKVPKDADKGFPDYQVQWRNLLLGCQTCNSAKGARPDKNDVPGGSSMGEEDWYLATMKLWVWPDSTPETNTEPALSGDQTYRLFQYVSDSRSQAGLLADGLLRKYWTGTPVWLNTAATMTWVVPNETYIAGQFNADALRTRVKTTITNLNLNRYNPNDETYNDRRVLNRTAAYAAATASLQRLQTVYQAAQDNYKGNARKAVIRMIVKTIRQSVMAMGFWSIWFQVFRGALDTPPMISPWHGVDVSVRKDLLLRTLVYYYAFEQDNNDTVLIFAGTDVSRLNLSTFA